MIWIIAGTKNARELIAVLLNRGQSILASVTTEYGRNLLEERQNLTLLAKPLNVNEMIDLVKEYSIKLIIDASHPFAEEVSNNAITVSGKTGTPYVRYERRSVEYSGTKNFVSYEKAAEYLKEKSGNILLTIGSKNLNLFSKINGSNLFARVLPLQSSIESCEKAGFTPDRIIALRFPFSKEFNKALYNDLNIQYLVTKDSGEEGGVQEKLDAAFELGIEVIVIDRPDIKYPDVAYDLNEIVSRVGAVLNG